MAKQGPDDLSGIVTFGREPHVELPLGRERDHAEWGLLPDGNATNIGAALELAGDLLPRAQSGPLRRIVLLSDGNETLGDAQRALLRPQMRDIEVAVVTLPPRLQDTAVTGLTVAPQIREGDPVEARVAILSPTNLEATLELRAIGGTIDQLIASQPVQLQGGPNEIPVVLGELPRGTWSIHAKLIVDGDSRPENNESWAFTIVGEPARVLVVEGVANEASAVVAALSRAKIQVDRQRPAQLPVQPEALLPYDSVVLANVHAQDLRKDQMQALQRFVGGHGHGLVVIGGERTFGLGDYADTPLEETLPVTVQPPEREQAASLALVLVIDRSGSMQGQDTGDRRTSRMDLAKEGAIQAIETLQEGDQVGVIAFDYTARWISDVKTLRGKGDMQSVTDRISTITPDGGTDIFAGLELAYKGLQQVSARVKHVILLTDGEQGTSMPFPTLINSMRRAGITLTTMGISSDIGSKAQADMADWARRGGGRYYFTNTARDVPRIMTQEARLAGKSFKQERDFKPRLVTAAPAVRGLVPADFPPLHGYVRVSPKQAAEIVLTSDQEEAILAQWQYGLGRATVWTADAQGTWGKDWVDTDQFNRFWPQAVRWTMAAPTDPGMQVSIRPDGAWATVRVEAFEPTGEFRNRLHTSVDVLSPDQIGRRLTLPQVAPGRYEGRVALSGPGVYFMQVTQQDEHGEVVASQTTGYALPQLAEYQLTPTNRVLMERLAADTGGPVLDSPEQAWRRDTGQGWQPQEVWTYLLGAALTLFVMDVAARRLRLSLADVAVLRRLARRLPFDRLRQVQLPRIQLHPVQAGRRR
jgi:Mg-chelatase subunit ChlD